MTIIDTLYDLAMSISDYISQGVFGIVYSFLYPFQLISYWTTTIINLVWDTFIDLIVSMWGIFYVYETFSRTLLIAMIPNLWTSIILLGLIIAFVLRLYYFLKDISILGFSV